MDINNLGNSGFGVEFITFGMMTEEQKQTYSMEVEQYLTKHALEYKMLVKTAGEIALQDGIVVLVDGELSGYVGASPAQETPTGNPAAELGSLFVTEEQRKNGYAKHLVAMMTIMQVVKGITPYAFCNDNSLGLFKKLGYVIPDNPNAVLPAEAFEGCGNCEIMKLGAVASGCCDIQVIYGGNIDEI